MKRQIMVFMDQAAYVYFTKQAYEMHVSRGEAILRLAVRGAKLPVDWGLPPRKRIGRPRGKKVKT